MWSELWESSEIHNMEKDEGIRWCKGNVYCSSCSTNAGDAWEKPGSAGWQEKARAEKAQILYALYPTPHPVGTLSLYLGAHSSLTGSGDGRSAQTVD